MCVCGVCVCVCGCVCVWGVCVWGVCVWGVCVGVGVWVCVDKCGSYDVCDVYAMV